MAAATSLLLGALLIALLPARPAVSGTASTESPEDQILVVQSNLQEAWQRSDMRDQSELDNYVTRLLNQVPFIPDVLLLEEVRRKSAKYVMEKMTDAIGMEYGWGVKPPRRPWTQNPQRRTETDSGILINTETVRKLDPGGYISLTYKRRHATDRVERVEITQHARVSVEEINGTLSLAGAAVHLQYGHLKSRQVDRYQEKWTNQLANVMADRYPAPVVRTIGGDFNQDRCATKSGARSCRKEVFWRNLTGDPWNYEDVLYQVFLDGAQNVGLGGVDFIFTTGSSIDGGSDVSYDRHNSSQFYSDHRFFWGLIGL